jgi:hypothetical protein
MTKERKKDPNFWTPHKGPYKVIKLKLGEGLTPPLTEEQPIEGVRLDQRRHNW